MSTTRVLLLAALGCCLAATTGRAAQPAAANAPQADPKLLLDTVRSNATALVAANLQLTPDEAAKFWPVYARYRQEINAIGDRMAALIQDYTAHFQDLSNDKALQILQDYLAAEADRIKVRQAYVPQFSQVIPGRTVARFYQLENKMDAVMRYELAAAIPVVDQGSSGPAK
jgi:hypothetical protein